MATTAGAHTGGKSAPTSVWGWTPQLCWEPTQAPPDSAMLGWGAWCRGGGKHTLKGNRGGLRPNPQGFCSNNLGPCPLHRVVTSPSRGEQRGSPAHTGLQALLFHLQPLLLPRPELPAHPGKTWLVLTTSNEAKTNSLTDKVFKALAIRILTKLGKETNEHSQNFNKKLENIKKKKISQNWRIQ